MMIIRISFAHFCLKLSLASFKTTSIIFKSDLISKFDAKLSNVKLPCHSNFYRNVKLPIIYLTEIVL